MSEKSRLIGARLLTKALEPDACQVRLVEGKETISQLFQFTVHIVLSEGVDVDRKRLMTDPATLEIFEGDEVLRRVHGIISTVRDRFDVGSKRELVLELVPRAFRAKFNSKHDVYQDQRVPALLAATLEEGVGLSSPDDVELLLDVMSYPEREFLVQYDESDLDFVQRWAEHLGIFYFFKHDRGRDRMVFGDANDHFPTLPRQSFIARGSAVGGVFELESLQTMVPREFRARDYNYRNPSMDVTGAANIDAPGAGVANEFGAHVKTPDEANALAQVRAQEAATRSHRFEGASDRVVFAAGRRVVVDGHARGELPLLITQVVHRFEASTMHGSGDDGPWYRNTFAAVLDEGRYRPPRLTKRPVVSGTLTGVVESESPTEFGAIDDEGRYRVSFMYDSVTGRGDGKASRPLRMAQPSAGADRGLHVPLKAGTEVLITCVNGDPDRPIIAGAVPNPRTGSPVNASNAEKSVLRTNMNSLALDDREPRAKLCVDGDQHIFQLGQPNFKELGFVLASVDNGSQMVNGVQTTVSDIKTSWQAYKTASAAKNIVDIAGLKTPWSQWQKIEAVLKGALGFVKSVSAIAGNAHAIAQKSASDKKKRADERYDQERAAILRELAAAETEAENQRQVAALAEGVCRTAEPNPFAFPAGAKTVQNSDGTTRLETKKEFGDRILKSLAADPEGKAKHARLTPLVEAQAAASKDEQEAQKKWDESWLNVGKGTDAEVIKAVESVMGVFGTTGLLYSKLSKLFSKATDEANSVVAWAHQLGAQLTADMSTGRRKAKVGAFNKPHNIQASLDSVGIIGMKNALVSGRDHATLCSGKDTTVAADGRAHVKGIHGVEVASPYEVAVSTDGLVDILGRRSVQMVANRQERKAPDGVALMLNSQAGYLLQVESGDIDQHAKRHFHVRAEQGNVGIYGAERSYVGGGAYGMVASANKVCVGRLSSPKQLDDARVVGDHALVVLDGGAQLVVENSAVSLIKDVVEIAAGQNRVTVTNGDMSANLSGELRVNSRRVLLG